MINIKSFIVIIFSTCFIFNIVNALTIYNDHSIQIHTDMSFKKDKRYENILDKKNIVQYDHSCLDFMVFGKYNVNKYFSTYFSTRYNFYDQPIDHKIHEITLNKMHYSIFGLCISKLGILEYGIDYHLIHNINNISHIFLFDNINLNLLNTYNSLMSKINHSVTIKSKNFFGLIKNVNLITQYQYPNHYFCKYHPDNIMSNLIKYKFKKINIILSSAYLSDVYNFFNMSSKPTHEMYSFSAKYKFNKLHILYLYNEIYNEKSIIKTDIRKYSIQNSALCVEYHLFSKLYITLQYLKLKNMAKISCIDYKSNDLNLSNQLNISIKYNCEKNICLYYNYKINLNNVSNVNLFNYINMFDVGIMYCF